MSFPFKITFNTQGGDSPSKHVQALCQNHREMKRARELTGDIEEVSVRTCPSVWLSTEQSPPPPQPASPHPADWPSGCWRRCYLWPSMGRIPGRPRLPFSAAPGETAVFADQAAGVVTPTPGVRGRHLIPLHPRLLPQRSVRVWVMAS